MWRVHNYRELRVWHAACDLAVAICEVTSSFPVTEQFGFTSQMRRAAMSAAANIAEGAGRGSVADFRRFIGIASGSAFECETHVTVAQRVGLLDAETAGDLLRAVSSVKRMLFRLSKSLEDH